MSTENIDEQVDREVTILLRCTWAAEHDKAEEYSVELVRRLGAERVRDAVLQAQEASPTDGHVPLDIYGRVDRTELLRELLGSDVVDDVIYTVEMANPGGGTPMYLFLREH